MVKKIVCFDLSYRSPCPVWPRIYAPGGTMHMVARRNIREFYFAAQENFEVLLDHLEEMSSEPERGHS